MKVEVKNRKQNHKQQYNLTHFEKEALSSK